MKPSLNITVNKQVIPLLVIEPFHSSSVNRTHKSRGLLAITWLPSNSYRNHHGRRLQKTEHRCQVEISFFYSPSISANNHGNSVVSLFSSPEDISFVLICFPLLLYLYNESIRDGGKRLIAIPSFQDNMFVETNREGFQRLLLLVGV